MIEYSKIKCGDILRMSKPTPDYILKKDDLVRVKSLTAEGVLVEDKNGQDYEFVFNCGRAYLDYTEWKDDFKHD